VKHKFFITLFFLAGISAIVFAISGKPHDFLENECGYCHIDVKTLPKSINTDITAGCEICHSEYSKTQSHPTDIYPRLSTPDDMPLTEGKLTCITCHYVHIDNNVQRNKKHYFLRRQIRGIVFCGACHKIDDNKHIVFESVHKKGYQEKDRSTRIDRMSLECIECHDNYAANMDGFLGAGNWNHMRNEYNHPIGTSYKIASTRRPKDFRPASMLNKEIKLHEGKIGCGTCHNMYSKEKNMLIMSNRGSKLCLECHLM
jgi:predicted CXXCH cytochrome family protein